MLYLRMSKRLLEKTIKSIRVDGYKITAKKIINKLYIFFRVPKVEAFPNNGYYSLYQDNEIAEENEAKVKALAFYLPQFHIFPENDEWWGKGFTEWTNTRKSAPRYRKHYQPREPHIDIGYYDLSDVEILKKHAIMAKQHDIYGFCIYYYWFSGKRLMEKPLDLLLAHPEIELNFCLCWANENWTRRWDGGDNEILIKQQYTDDDAVLFIEDIQKYVIDSRYIKYHGKPVIIVYNPGQIINLHNVFSKWKDTAREIGLGEISIWICRSFQNSIDSLGLSDLVDKEVEFPIHGLEKFLVEVNNPDVHVNDSNIFDYSATVDNLLKHREAAHKKLCRGVMLGWDNSARRKNGFCSFDNFDIAKYYKWLRANVDETVQNNDIDDRYIFINAWNEWAEGTYLEPDKKYGYSYLNITTKAITQREYCLENVICDKNVKSRIAIQVHIYYIDLTYEIIDYINNIPEPYHCYVSTDSVYKAEKIIDAFKSRCNATKIVVTVYENRGRDVAPFFMQMQKRALEYSYICHIHSKRSLHAIFGEKWRTYLFSNLLGTSQGIAKIIDYFDKHNDVGIIYPHVFKNLLSVAFDWGDDKEIAENVFHKLNVDFDFNVNIEFPIGNMLWFKTKAVYQFFENIFTWEDFPEEDGQFDGTVMHAIEHLWVCLANSNGFRKECMNISLIDDKF